MAKERFEDNTYDLLQALTHASISKKFFEMLVIDKSFDVKMIFKQYIQRINFIESNIYDRLGEDSRKAYKDMLINGDTVFVNEMSKKFSLLGEEQKPIIESIVNSLIAGETINVEIDNKQLI